MREFDPKCRYSWKEAFGMKHVSDVWKDSERMDTAQNLYLLETLE